MGWLSKLLGVSKQSLDQNCAARRFLEERGRRVTDYTAAELDELSHVLRLDEKLAELDDQMRAEEREHPSSMWDWISPARIKRPYVA